MAKKLELKDYRKQSFDILRNRSKFTAKIKEEKNEGRSPLESHEAMRATFGLGSRNGNLFEEVAYRPAYQSLTDNNYGLLKGAEINFLETAFRHYDNENKIVLQNFDLVSIRSISPIDEMFQPLSFQVKANVERWQPDEDEEGYVANLRVGGGGAYDFNDWMRGFMLINSEAGYGGFLPRNQWAGVGGQVGILVDVGNLRVLAETEKVYASSKIGAKTIYKGEAVYSLSRNWAAAAHYKYQQNYGHDIDEIYLGVRSYF